MYSKSRLRLQTSKIYFEDLIRSEKLGRETILADRICRIVQRRGYSNLA